MIEASSTEKKCPSGHVERTLNYRERNLLIGAARDYCKSKEHSDFKNQSKLDRLSKLIQFEETLEYFSMIDDNCEDAVREWKTARLHYTAWMDLKAGLSRLDDFKRNFPKVDPEKGVEKPSRRVPESSPSEMRGESKVYYLPSKLDAWVQDILKSANWNPLAAEFAVELCARFDVKDDDF